MLGAGAEAGPGRLTQIGQGVPNPFAASWNSRSISVSSPFAPITFVPWNRERAQPK
jgi:hypothetical protein